MSFILWFWLFNKKSKRFIWREICERTHCPSIVKLTLLLFLSQAVRARELKFWENVHPTPCVTCHISHVRCQVTGDRCHMSCVRCLMWRVMCQVSCVMCSMSHVFFSLFLFFPFFSDKVVELVGIGSVINRAYLPGLVSRYQHNWYCQYVLKLETGTCRWCQTCIY